MSEDQTAGGTLHDGSVTKVTGTSTHNTLPNAPSWFSQLLQNPIQIVTLVGVLSLSGVQVGSLVAGSEDPTAVESRLKKEIERVEREAKDRALLEKAARCTDRVDGQLEALNSLSADLKRRDDDKFAFMSELTIYVEKIANALIRDKNRRPEPGSRLDEFVKKGTLRGIRTD